MSVIKTNGLILKHTNMNDNDRLFTIFCSGHGKMSALSKGIRSHKHKDFAALQPFCYSELVIDTSRGLGYISSAQIIENFFDIRQSVEKMSLASYITDLVSFMADEIIYDEDFFRFTLNTLYMISKATDTKDMPLLDELLRLKAIYELKAVTTAGYMPDFSSCITCGSSKELEYFDIYNGGAVCSVCGKTGKAFEIAEISKPTLDMMAYICMSDHKQCFSFKTSPEAIREMGYITETYLINKLELVSAQLEYFKNIIKN